MGHLETPSLRSLVKDLGFELASQLAIRATGVAGNIHVHIYDIYIIFTYVYAYLYYMKSRGLTDPLTTLIWLAVQVRSRSLKRYPANAFGGFGFQKRIDLGSSQSIIFMIFIIFGPKSLSHHFRKKCNTSDHIID